MLHRPRPARAFAPRLSFGVTGGSSKGEKAGFPPLQVGIARTRTFYRCFAGPILKLPRTRHFNHGRGAYQSGLVFERAINSVGHRAHLLPQFNLKGSQRLQRSGALGDLRRRFGPHCGLLHRRSRPGWDFRRGADAGSVRVHARLCTNRTARRYPSYHRASSRRICAGRRKDGHRSDPLALLAGVSGGRRAIARRTGAGDRGKSPRFGNGRTRADGSHAESVGIRATITLSVRAAAAGCAGASSFGGGNIGVTAADNSTRS